MQAPPIVKGYIIMLISLGKNIEAAQIEKAIEYAEKNNISYTVIEPNKKEFVIKSYADNFLKD